MIDDSAKTYTVNNIDTSSSRFRRSHENIVDRNQSRRRKVQGFNCEHVRVISTRSMGVMGKFTDTVELWNSPDVPMAPFFRNYMDKNLSRAWTTLMSPEAADQLMQMGFTGFMVKIQIRIRRALTA